MKKLRNLLFLFVFLCFSGMALAEPVNINTADTTTLASAIKGVGIKKAAAIVAYREEYGPFKTISELTLVKGIGMKIVKSNIENLSVGKEE